MSNLKITVIWLPTCSVNINDNMSIMEASNEFSEMAKDERSTYDLAKKSHRVFFILLVGSLCDAQLESIYNSTAWELTIQLIFQSENKKEEFIELLKEYRERADLTGVTIEQE